MGTPQTIASTDDNVFGWVFKEKTFWREITTPSEPGFFITQGPMWGYCRSNVPCTVDGACYGTCLTYYEETELVTSCGAATETCATYQWWVRDLMELVGGPPSSFGLVDITEGISGSKASTLYYKYAVVTTRPTEAIATTTYELPPPAVSGGSYATSESSIWESSLPNSESSNWESSLPNSESSDWESSLPKLRSHPPVQGGLEPISGGQPYLSETPPNNTGIIVGSVVGGVAVLAIAGIVIFFIYRRSKRYQIPPEPVWDTPEFVYPAAAGKATSEGESTSAHVPFQTSQGQGQGSAVEIGGQERKAGLQGRLQYDCWHWVGRPKL